MEISEAKALWQQMDQRLDRQQELQFATLRERHLGNARSRLRPLFWGMACQIVFGVISIMMAASFWIGHLAQPALWISGAIVHLYGILLVALAGFIMHRIHRLDMGAPVTNIQKQLIELRKHYIRCGWVVGLPWWVMWLPYAIIATHSRYGLFDAGLPPAFFAITMVCMAMMVLTIGVVIWAQNPKRPQLAARTEALLAGVSLTRAQQSLDELGRFERDDTSA